MGKQEFDNYLQKAPTETSQATEQLIDWDAEGSMWLQRLDELYLDLEEWLADYQKDGRVQLAFRPIQMFENGIGPYVTRTAEIQVGNALVKLIPIGTALVGVKGRVDLEGPRDTVRFVLAHRNATRPQVAYRQRVYASAQAKAEAEQFLRDRGLEGLLADDWVWKASTNPPHITYTDLTQDTFLGSLLQVINGTDAV